MLLSIATFVVRLLHSEAVKDLIIGAVGLLAKRTDNQIDDDAVKLVTDALSKF